jgi:hypothetical protein
MLLVANSTPIVDFDSKLNSFRVNLESKFDFPTPESPIKTTSSVIYILMCEIKQNFLNLFKKQFLQKKRSKILLLVNL